MAISQRLDLRQTQSLVMTPQLQQAIKLLQMSNVELTAYVEQELEQNPLLERDERPEEGSESVVDAADGEGEATVSAERIEALDFASLEKQSAGLAEPMDAEAIGNMWETETPSFGLTGRSEAGGSHSFDAEGGGFEQTLSEKPSLHEHLVRQLHMEMADPQDRLIGLHLIDMIDEAGYLTGEIGQVAELLGCSVERVERTLLALQQFDPPGLFARSLKECLMLQLRDRNRYDPVIELLLDNLDLVGRREIAALMRICRVDAAELSEMVAEIRALDPKPALAFEHAVAEPVTPDIFMRPKAGGGWVVELNSETLPRVLVNNQYHAEIAQGARTKEDKRYISDCFQSASWLVKSLHQRATTILKVSSEIVRQQEAFFAHGVKFLKPLILRDIAAEIQMHESTVSRVTSNKYMATPRGIYELKYFFTPALNNSMGGASHSAESVRHSIKSLIDGEPPDDVLSDDKIVEILRREGIDVARRTVAKYREAMRISSSVQRRREKAIRL
jgi:RNA polymerase sigma-54 factor